MSDELEKKVADLEKALAEKSKQYDEQQQAFEKNKGTWRSFERKYKKLTEVLGEENPERVAEFRARAERSDELEERLERAVQEAKDKLAAEHNSAMQAKDAELADMQRELDQMSLSYAKFRAFNATGAGVPENFNGLDTLTRKHVVSGDKGIEIRDDAGTRVMFKPEGKGQVERPATLDDFMIMIQKGQLENYAFSDRGLLQQGFKTAKSSGADFPTKNGDGTGPKDWRELSGDQLWGMALSTPATNGTA